jgi:hypothetical protein
LAADGKYESSSEEEIDFSPMNVFLYQITIEALPANKQAS